MSSNLERLALRVTQDPSFLAAALARYAHSERLDDAALAARLGCAVATLTALRLCRMPRSQPPHFWQDVTAIAARCGVDADGLAEVVRRGQVLLQLQRSSQEGTPGFLLAARDDERRPRKRPRKGDQP